ncbi:probable LRR receptor-like serine/threonine-protein kinase At1g51810 [Arachis duranensis]|uniref:Probable LRR receptor-like Serine/threonine-protein kinase At1g51810 n=1 Tax=Arachis duranensis TaxID=130453 RepID=A0A6P5N5X4_ARADU|nr:probable LRR receptor-like serine/threonine-protein kinase At1g51810 [Arachis duranensis]
MAASLVGGAAIGAVFGELLKAVIDMRDRAVMFKPTLAYLTTTLTAIDPVIKEIEQQNNELGRANTELELLIKEMEEGTKLVYKCSKIHKLNFPARIRYQEQLVALVESLVRFFIIDMQAQTARDLKETLMKVRRIHSAVNKMQSNSNDEETGGGGIVSEDSDSGSANVAVEANQMDLTDETTVTIQQNDECVTEITNSVPVIANSVPETAVEPKILRNNSLEQVMEDLLHLVSQNKEKANNSQEEKHLTTIKSYDQSYPDRKRFMGICLPITPILNKISGGFNPLEPPSVHCMSCDSIIQKNTTSHTEDIETYLYCNRCYDDHIRRKIIFYEGCPHKFDIKELLRASAEVLGNTSYAITCKILLKNGVTLVVKRLKDVMVKKKIFEEKIEIVQRISQHPNVLSPLACYYCSNGENLLVYDYMTKGSFFELLHGTTKDRENPLDWDSRMKILLGVAKGLAHIHSLDGGNYVHGNIRSSNVLVTNDHQGCISDLSMTYSLSISFPQFRNTGYQDRDFCFGRKEKVNVLTQKCDVYSFGVLLFEMLTGRVPSEYNDARAIGDNIQDAWKMKELADECASLVPSKSPSMDEVVRRMEKIRAS